MTGAPPPLGQVAFGLSGWGRFPRADCRVTSARDEAAARTALAGGDSWIARGLGRAYGDAALNPHGVLDMSRAGRMLAFDPQTGLLACEAGVSLADIVATFAPRGWFPPVTPGTQFVTVGGMAACDVHGKNHHVAGAFSRHVAWLDLLTAEGETIRCSRDQRQDLFMATLGGMGLTGVILRLAFPLIRLPSGFMRQDTVVCADLTETIEAFETRRDATYSVAWTDCSASGAGLGRSLAYFAEHADPEEIPTQAPSPPLRTGPRVPFDLPAINPLSVRAFNTVHYSRGRAGRSYVGLQPYFYPLDSLRDWPRLYGAGGFVQHQCVLPPDGAEAALRALIGRIQAAGSGSFLVVLKTMGATTGGPLSFPMPGWTLAIDFSATAQNFSLLIELDAIVADHGGRLYLAKDARTGVAGLRGYKALDAFREQRDRIDPNHRFRSLQSERLGL